MNPFKKSDWNDFWEQVEYDWDTEDFKYYHRRHNHNIILKYFPVWPILVQSSALIFNNNKYTKLKKGKKMFNLGQSWALIFSKKKNYQTLKS